MLPEWKIGMMVRVNSTSSTSKPGDPDLSHANKRSDVCNRQRLHLFIELLNKLIPVFEADFKDLAVLNLGYPDKVKMRMSEVIFIRESFNKL